MVEKSTPANAGDLRYLIHSCFAESLPLEKVEGSVDYSRNFGTRVSLTGRICLHTTTIAASCRQRCSVQRHF